MRAYVIVLLVLVLVSLSAAMPLIRQATECETDGECDAGLICVGQNTANPDARDECLSGAPCVCLPNVEEEGDAVTEQEESGGGAQPANPCDSDDDCKGGTVCLGVGGVGSSALCLPPSNEDLDQFETVGGLNQDSCGPGLPQCKGERECKNSEGGECEGENNEVCVCNASGNASCEKDEDCEPGEACFNFKDAGLTCTSRRVIADLNSGQEQEAEAEGEEGEPEGEEQAELEEEEEAEPEQAEEEEQAEEAAEGGEDEEQNEEGSEEENGEENEGENEEENGEENEEENSEENEEENEEENGEESEEEEGEEEGPPDEERFICIDARALSHLPADDLVYPTHGYASVKCDSHGSCATPGHMVTYNGKAMMMRSYCDMIGSCTNEKMHVNSPRYRLQRRIKSRTPGLEYTAFAARYETRAEETLLSTAVRVGL